MTNPLVDKTGAEREVAYNDQAVNPVPPKEKRRIAVWDDRPRFLGIFSAYDLPKDKAPQKRFGVMDHMQTCRDCAMGHGGIHPTIHAVCAYVYLFGSLISVSLPTWLK